MKDRLWSGHEYFCNVVNLNITIGINLDIKLGLWVWRIYCLQICNYQINESFN
jgi:hypothetical protein